MEEVVDIAGSTSDKHGKKETAPLLSSVGGGGRDQVPFEEALEGVGVGVFHVILLFVAGWALASDSVEVQCISFVTPQLDGPHSQLHPTKVVQLPGHLAEQFVCRVAVSFPDHVNLGMRPVAPEFVTCASCSCTWVLLISLKPRLSQSGFCRTASKGKFEEAQV